MTLREALQASVTMQDRATQGDAMLATVLRWRREDRNAYDRLLRAAGIAYRSEGVERIPARVVIGGRRGARAHVQAGGLAHRLLLILRDGHPHPKPELLATMHVNANSLWAAVLRLRWKGFEIRTEREVRTRQSALLLVREPDSLIREDVGCLVSSTAPPT